MKKIAVNINLQLLFKPKFSFIWDKSLRVQLVGHMVIVWLVF